MWYVVEVHSHPNSEWKNETALWGPFPGHEHAHRWVQGQQALDKPDMGYTIRPLFKAD